MITVPEKTLCRYLYDLALEQPEKKLLGDAVGWMTASQLMQSVAVIGRWLTDCGVRPGEPVALCAQRSAVSIAALFALRLAGAVAVLTNPHCQPEEALRDCGELVGVRCCLVGGNGDVLTLRRGDVERHLAPDRGAVLSGPVQVDGDCREPGYIIFTSGSTGKSKAVTLCDRNLAANLVDSRPLGDYRKEDLALCIVPFDHVFGLVLAAGMAILEYGLYLPAYTDTRSILAAIQQEKLTRMNGVPSLYQAMAEQAPDFCLDSLRVGFIGGAPVTGEQFARMEKALGMTLVPVYGMSECIGVACGSWQESQELRCTTAGRIYSLNTVRILDENGAEQPVGKAGELWVNGPARMLGYWPRRMEPERFLPTGDLGYLTKGGYLILTGRKKDIIIRNGKNLSPVRIEAALLSMPGVTAAAVVGLPDEKQGEVPYAMVAGIADPAELKKLLLKNELPAGILCTEALPLTASGKPDKPRIRALLLEWRQNSTAVH